MKALRGNAVSALRLRSLLFFLQRGFELRLASRDELLVSDSIKENFWPFLGQARELALEVEVAAVRTEEDVARERPQHAEGACEILRDAGV